MYAFHKAGPTGASCLLQSPLHGGRTGGSGCGSVILSRALHAAEEPSVCLVILGEAALLEQLGTRVGQSRAEPPVRPGFRFTNSLAKTSI